MVLSTLTVAAVATPTVVSTGFAHYLNKRSNKGKPASHFGYNEGLHVVRKFLEYASHRPVEELQAFTQQYVPVPTWVHVEEAEVAEEHLQKAAELLVAQLGPDGVEQVGGKLWWKWRLKELKTEWIEMKKDSKERIAHPERSPRTMLYVHGGAYYFGSVDEHRYQMQRHARKLKARVFAPRYRLAPQFPFPCGLQDIIAAYLHLLTLQPASTIILSGDSAGGGMVTSVLCVLRDQSIPLPAGAILISPWVDLTHSFPSLTEENSRDYIPAHGFLHRPSVTWPPPTEQDIEDAVQETIADNNSAIADNKNAVMDDNSTTGIHNTPATLVPDSAETRPRSSSANLAPESAETRPRSSSRASSTSRPRSASRGEIQEQAMGYQKTRVGGAGLNKSAQPQKRTSVVIEGVEVRILDQIQMYATNELLNHPLVSPVLQGSLGGLPPILIVTGGGEMLRDEQIYLAHKAANPKKYAPSPAFLAQNPTQAEALARFPRGTDVALQVYDDCCHVTPTLSFTKPAKYMYRAISRFGDWLLDRANPATQAEDGEGVKMDDASVISENSEESDLEDEGPVDVARHIGKIGRVQDVKAPLPPFSNHMIRQRIDRHGNIYPLDPAQDLPSMKLEPEAIGVIKPEPVRRWMEGKKKWDTKYAKAKRKAQTQRAKELAEGGYLDFGEDEKPPPSALAGRRRKDDLKVPERGTKASWGLKLWSMMGGAQDKETIETAEKNEKEHHYSSDSDDESTATTAIAPVATETTGASAIPATATAAVLVAAEPVTMTTVTPATAAAATNTSSTVVPNNSNVPDNSSVLPETAVPDKAAVTAE